MSTAHSAADFSALPYSSQGRLLTAGERRFFHDGLKPAVADKYLISFKVRLADVITVDEWTSVHGRRIAQKHLDFVLATKKSTKIVAVVELNDASHDRSDRQERDEFLRQALAAAGLPLVSFPIYQTYDPDRIARRIRLATVSVRKRRQPWAKAA